MHSHAVREPLLVPIRGATGNPVPESPEQLGYVLVVAFEVPVARVPRDRLHVNFVRDALWIDRRLPIKDLCNPWFDASEVGHGTVHRYVSGALPIPVRVTGVTP
jgi:hypothetical protein